MSAHDWRVASRFLVLSAPPAEAWLPYKLRDAFEVGVVWRAEDGWDGEDRREALDSFG